MLQLVAASIVFLGLVTLLTYVEKDSPQSSLINYPNAIWYAVVTLTSVGYGDIYPATTHGRVIGYIFVFLGTGAYAFFIGRIASFMTEIRENKRLGYLGTTFTKHVVILGWNEVSRNVVDQLIGVHRRAVVLTDTTTDIEAIHERYEDQYKFVFGIHVSDYESQEANKKSNMDAANVIFVNFENDMQKLIYVLNAKKQYSDKEFIVILDNSDLRNAFLGAGVNRVVAKNDIASKVLASYIFEPDVAAYSEDIISYAKDGEDYDIKQYRVTEQNPYLNREYQYAFFDLKRKFNCILIGLSKRHESGEHILIKNPAGNVKVQEGDYMILILSGKSSEKITETFSVIEGA